MKYDSVSVSYPERLDKRYPFSHRDRKAQIFQSGQKRFSKEVLEDTVINEDEPQASLKSRRWNTT